MTMAGTSPDDASSGKCFSGILSRILCIRSLPTHPSDQLPPDPPHSTAAFFDRTVKSTDQFQARISKTSPGVIARLMGLESMPDHLTAPKGRSFGEFLRSRSVNFIDYLPLIDQATETGEAQHRRVRTSVSFREAIGFDHREEKRDFFVLCFDNNEAIEDENPAMRKPPRAEAAKARKKVEKINYQKQSIVKKQRVMEQSKRNLEVNLPAKKKNVNVSVNVNRNCRNLALKEKRAVKKPVDYSDRASVESMPNSNKKKKNSNKIQPEIGLVLDHPKSSLTKSENSGKTLQKCSKKELPKCSNKVQQHKRKIDNTVLIKEQAPKTMEENICRGRKKEVGGSGEKMLAEICILAEEYASGCWWIGGGGGGGGGVFKFEDSEELCIHFSQQILDDVLLNDVVGELVLMNKSRF